MAYILFDVNNEKHGLGKNESRGEKEE